MLVCSNRSEDAAQPPVYKLCDSSVPGPGMPKSERAAGRSFPIGDLKSWASPAVLHSTRLQPLTAAPHSFLPSPPGFSWRSCRVMSEMPLSVSDRCRGCKQSFPLIPWLCTLCPRAAGCSATPAPGGCSTWDPPQPCIRESPAPRQCGWCQTGAAWLRALLRSQPESDEVFLCAAFAMHSVRDGAEKFSSWFIVSVFNISFRFHPPRVLIGDNRHSPLFPYFTSFLSVTSVSSLCCVGKKKKQGISSCF